jgi:drug/metabolite transporter (DMT)-like permease
MERVAPRDTQKFGFLFAVACAVLISTNYVTVKFALSGFNAETFSFLWTSTAALYALLIFSAGAGFKAAALPGKLIWPALLTGALNGAGSLFTWKGLTYLDPSLAAFLWRFHPVLTIFLGVVLLRERFMAIELLPVVLMVAGAFFTVASSWEALSTGVIMTLLACLFNSFQMLVVKRYFRENKPQIIVFYRNIIAALLIGAWAVSTGAFEFHQAGAFQWSIALGGSLLGETIAFMLLFKSLSFWDLSRTSLVRTLEPLLVIFWGYLWFHRTPGFRELAGGSMILIGVIGFTLIQRSQWRGAAKTLDPSKRLKRIFF